MLSQYHTFVYRNPTPEESEVIWSQYKMNNFFVISTHESKLEKPDLHDGIMEFWKKAYHILHSSTFKEEL